MSLKRKIKHCSARKQTSTTIVVLTTVAACYTLFNEIFEPPKTSELENLNCSYPNADLSKKYEDYLSVTSVLERTENCAEYIKVIHPEALAPTTEAERDFPLAFAYTVHKDIGILEMFLALYLRPMDSHCIHVDAKASHEMHHAVERIVKCYSEQFPKADVFLPRKSIPVFWGYGGSIMEADMICYKELKNRGRRWEMVANIAGTELPFVSHQKFREVLSRAGGNVMEIQRNRNKDRQRNFYEKKRYVQLKIQFTLYSKKQRQLTKYNFDTLQ